MAAVGREIGIYYHRKLIRLCRRLFPDISTEMLSEGDVRRVINTHSWPNMSSSENRDRLHGKHHLCRVLENYDNSRDGRFNFFTRPGIACVSGSCTPGSECDNQKPVGLAAQVHITPCAGVHWGSFISQVGLL